MKIFNDDIIDKFKAIQVMQHKGFASQISEEKESNGRTIIVNGKELLNFISCSYLGLDTNQLLKEGSLKAIDSLKIVN